MCESRKLSFHFKSHVSVMSSPLNKYYCKDVHLSTTAVYSSSTPILDHPITVYCECICILRHKVFIDYYLHHVSYYVMLSDVPIRFYRSNIGKILKFAKTSSIFARACTHKQTE